MCYGSGLGSCIVIPFPYYYILSFSFYWHSPEVSCHDITLILVGRLCHGVHNKEENSTINLRSAKGRRKDKTEGGTTSSQLTSNVRWLLKTV